MSPQECWLVIDAHQPPEKVGRLDKSKFSRLKEALKNAITRNTQNRTDA